MIRPALSYSQKEVSMAQSMVVFDSIAQSNIPHRHKSAITNYLDKLTGGRASEAMRSSFGGIRGHHVEAGGHLLRSSTESALVGGLLGAVHAEVGLDHFVPGDAVLSLLAMAASVALSGKGEVSTDFRILSSSALSVFSFRMGYKLMAEKAIAKGKQPAGMFVKGAKIAGESSWGDDMAGDSILEAARDL
jgi:hypothetical protein